MPQSGKNHWPMKAKVAVEAIKWHKRAVQIAPMLAVHPRQDGSWKKQARAGLPDVLGNGREQIRQQSDAAKDELYKQAGPLKVELDCLQKELASSLEQRPRARLAVHLCAVPGATTQARHLNQ